MRAVSIKTFLTLWLAATLAPAAVPPQPDLVNGIVAIVNGTIITEKEARAYIEPAITMLERQFANDPRAFQEKVMEASREGLNQLIERQLVLDDFKASGFNLPESLIEDFVQERIRERYGDRVKLIKTLEAQGMTYEQYRTDIRDQFIFEQMQLRHVSAAVLVSPYKIETYHRENQKDFQVPEQIRLRTIVLNKTASRDADSVRRLAQEILAKILAGSKFSEMASVYSDGAEKAQGGDRGWMNRSVLRKELAEAAGRLRAGERSGVIETPDACYLLQVDEIRPAHVKALAEVRDEVEKILLAQERARLHKQYVERLRKKAFIRFF